MSAKLDAIANRELWPLTPGEQARLMGLAARAGVKIVRGKAVGRIDGRMDKVWEDAARRVTAEEKATEAAKQAKADAKAKAKAARTWW